MKVRIQLMIDDKVLHEIMALRMAKKARLGDVFKILISEGLILEKSKQGHKEVQE